MLRIAECEFELILLHLQIESQRSRIIALNALIIDSWNIYELQTVRKLGGKIEWNLGGQIRCVIMPSGCR